MTTPLKRELWLLLPALLATAVLYGLLAYGTELWDRDEPRFARCAIEMKETGDWLVPKFRAEVRPDKPVLIYWLMNASAALFGRSEFAFRFPTILGMLVSGLFTFLVARKLFDAKTGALAAGIWWGSLTPAYIGTVATADGVMLACTTACFWIFALRLQGERARWHGVALALAFGLGLLTKGPVALAVPLLAWIGTRWIASARVRELAKGSGKLIGLAALTGFGLFAAWGIPANAASNNVLFELGIGRHVMGRMVTPQEGHGGTGFFEWLAWLPAHAPLIILGLFPFGALLIPALNALLRSGNDCARAVLIGWSLPTFVLMSLVATKLPHYTLPIFPALAIAIARHLNHQNPDAPPMPRGLTVAFRAGLVISYFAAGGGLFGLGFILTREGGGLTPMIAGSLCLLIVAYLGVTTWRYGNHSRSRLAKTLGTGAVLLALLLELGLLPSIEKMTKASDEVAAAIRAVAPRDIKVTTHGYSEPSIDFYLDQSGGTAVLGLDRRARAEGYEPLIAAWAKRKGPEVLVTSTERLAREQLGAEDLNAELILRRRVVNTASRMKWIEVLVFYRR